MGKRIYNSGDLFLRFLHILRESGDDSVSTKNAQRDEKKERYIYID